VSLSVINTFERGSCTKPTTRDFGVQCGPDSQFGPQTEAWEMTGLVGRG